MRYQYKAPVYALQLVDSTRVLIEAVLTTSKFIADWRETSAGGFEITTQWRYPLTFSMEPHDWLVWYPDSGIFWCEYDADFRLQYIDLDADARPTAPPGAHGPDRPLPMPSCLKCGCRVTNWAWDADAMSHTCRRCGYRWWDDADA